MNETALKERLRSIAKARGIFFNEIWKQLLLERFLARLSRSSHHEKFIFKGGLLLSQYIKIGRETTDADFLITKIKSEASTIESAFRDIIAIDATDGFHFNWSKIEELAQPHMEYGGYRVSLYTQFGKMKDKVQIDIGVGDLVEPIENNFHPFEYRGKPIFEGEITLLTYPVEAIFSEKLETIISKGAVNSRMKDYHDVILIIREKGLLNIDRLKKTLPSTFTHRGTPLVIPIEFDESGNSTLQQLWVNHLDGLGAVRKQIDLPELITSALTELNQWLIDHGFKN